jgi:hypothetical protein
MMTGQSIHADGDPGLNYNLPPILNDASGEDPQ